MEPKTYKVQTVYGSFELFFDVFWCLQTASRLTKVDGFIT